MITTPVEPTHSSGLLPQSVSPSAMIPSLRHNNTISMEHIASTQQLIMTANACTDPSDRSLYKTWLEMFIEYFKKADSNSLTDSFLEEYAMLGTLQPDGQEYKSVLSSWLNVLLRKIQTSASERVEENLINALGIALMTTDASTIHSQLHRLSVMTSDVLLTSLENEKHLIDKENYSRHKALVVAVHHSLVVTKWIGGDTVGDQETFQNREEFHKILSTIDKEGSYYPARYLAKLAIKSLKCVERGQRPALRSGIRGVKEMYRMMKNGKDNEEPSDSQQGNGFPVNGGKDGKTGKPKKKKVKWYDMINKLDELRLMVMENPTENSYLQFGRCTDESWKKAYRLVKTDKKMALRFGIVNQLHVLAANCGCKAVRVLAVKKLLFLAKRLTDKNRRGRDAEVCRAVLDALNSLIPGDEPISDSATVHDELSHIVQCYPIDIVEVFLSDPPSDDTQLSSIFAEIKKKFIAERTSVCSRVQMSRPTSSLEEESRASECPIVGEINANEEFTEENRSMERSRGLSTGIRRTSSGEDVLRGTQRRSQDAPAVPSAFSVCLYCKYYEDSDHSLKPLGTVQIDSRVICGHMLYCEVRALGGPATESSCILFGETIDGNIKRLKLNKSIQQNGMTDGSVIIVCKRSKRRVFVRRHLNELVRRLQSLRTEISEGGSSFAKDRLVALLEHKICDSSRQSNYSPGNEFFKYLSEQFRQVMSSVKTIASCLHSAHTTVEITIEEFADSSDQGQPFYLRQVAEAPYDTDDSLPSPKVYLLYVGEDYRFRASLRQKIWLDSDFKFRAAKVTTPDGSSVDLDLSETSSAQRDRAVLIHYSASRVACPLLKKPSPLTGFNHEKYVRLVLSLELEVASNDGTAHHWVHQEIYVRMVPPGDLLRRYRVMNKAEEKYERAPVRCKRMVDGCMYFCENGVSNIPVVGAPMASCFVGIKSVAKCLGYRFK